MSRIEKSDNKVAHRTAILNLITAIINLITIVIALIIAIRGG